MKNKGKAIFGLGKIPVNELLKLSRTEVGQLKAYIDELEDENKRLNSKIKSYQSMSRQERRNMREQIFKENTYKELQIKYDTEHSANKVLKRKAERYFSELVLLRAKFNIKNEIKDE